MYNKEILEALIREFGVENAIIYCRLESRKSQLMFQDSIRNGEIGSSEWEHERDWWKENETELLTIKSKNDEFVRTSKKQPKVRSYNKAVVSSKNVR
jgi:hypothetical protein